MKEVGRNDPCPCGSGRKAKKCCGAASPQPTSGPAPLRAAAQEFLPAMLLAALETHRKGDLPAARNAYRQILAIDPGIEQVNSLLATVQRQIERQGKPSPDREKAALLELAMGFNGLGVHFHESRHYPEARTCFQTALGVVPDLPEPLNNLGNVARAQGQRAEALACYRAAIACAPAFVIAHLNLATTLKEMGHADQALASFEKVLALDPDNGTAQHAVVALRGITTESAPQGFVTNLFDQYAEDFDSQLVKALQYAAPEKLAALLMPWLGEPTAGHDVLDLGCGTGLMGARIAPWCRSLAGVDLSAKMLEKARARKLYHRLVQAELNSFMAAEAAACYDCILSTDVFIYLGALEKTVQSVKRLLRPGGLFAFSVEALEHAAIADASPPAAAYRLCPTGRYAHSSAYLHGLAEAAGMEVIEQVAAPTRIQQQQPVIAWFFLWRSK